MTYVSSEVKNPQRNIVRVLVIGPVLVTAVYVLVNGAFLNTLDQDKMASSQAIAVDTMAKVIIFFAGSFIDTVLYTAPVVWLFFLATGLSVFVLRHKEPQTPRPYWVTGFPITPIIFCSCCLFMLYSSVSYALAVKRTGLFIVSGVLLAGFFLYWFTEGPVKKRVFFSNSFSDGFVKSRQPVARPPQ